jgi:hypothetical protein
MSDSVFARMPLHWEYQLKLVLLAFSHAPIKSFVVQIRALHCNPFEYEYRCTEYEYGLPDELPIGRTLAAGGWG